MTGVSRNEKGIALFLVLWVLTLLSVIVGEFCFAMRTEVNITRNFKEQTEAYYIALAGLNTAIGELIRNEFIPEKVNQSEGDGTEGEQWRVNVDIPPVLFGEGQFEVKIGNENGKININGAKRPLLEIMLNGLDLEEQQRDIIVDSIMDWRDEDHLHRVNGAEDSYYRNLPEPYECKDGGFDSVEELLMVRGVTPEMFYGGLEDIVTVFKAPKGRKRLRHGWKITGPEINKININAAPKKLLLALPSMTDDLTQQIVEHRKKRDFKSLTEVSFIVGSKVYPAIAPYITLEASKHYSIVSVGKAQGGKIRQGVKALVEINRRIKKGYRVMQWRDSLKYQEEQSPRSED